MATPNFNESRQQGIDSVYRDSAGRLLKWRENGFQMESIRDAAGHLVSVRATGNGAYSMDFKRDANGVCLGISGDVLNTQFMSELSAAGQPLTIRNSAQGVVLSDDGREAVRQAVTDTSPQFADEVISISVAGCATALPCTLRRVRCSKVTGSPVLLTIYDDNNLSTGRVIWSGTLAQDADAVDIPDEGLPAMTGLYCKWVGTAGNYNFHISVGAAQ